MLCVEMPPGRPHSTAIFKQDKHECVHPITHLFTIQKEVCTAWTAPRFAGSVPTIKISGRQRMTDTWGLKDEGVNVSVHLKYVH